MAQKKAHEVDAWLRRPDDKVGAVLLYGPDRGMVSERAARFAATTGLDLSDPFSVVRLDAAEIDSQPGRLVDELTTIPMFASRRLVWVKGGAQKGLADDARTALGLGLADAVLLVEAGDLKKGAALRTVFEGAGQAMALPCYADQGRTIDALIDEVLGAAKLQISGDARDLLRQNLGGDRLASRAELEKLALYCAGSPRIEAADVLAAIGDVAGQSPDDAVDAVLLGRPDALDLAYRRWTSSGQPGFLILAAVQRQFQQLQRLRAEVDRGGSAAQAVAAARPPVFFSRRQVVETGLTRWAMPAIERALARLQGATLLSRQRPGLDDATTRQALLALALEAGRRRA